MLDFLGQITNRREHTKDTARQRLQVALIRDRVDLAPEVMEAMKRDILKVMGRYLVAGDDFSQFEIHLKDKSAVLVSNIRIRRLNRWPALPRKAR